MPENRSNRARSGSRLGLIGLAVKLAPKLLSALAKLAKGLKLGKFGLAGASLAAYSILWSWQFALVLLAALFFHESGHLWAMKRCGLKTKGVYFIPLLGAAAVSEDVFPSRRAETFIALMGPIWGFGLALAVFGLYLLTGSPLAAALAGWMAMINLFNLLPINPLDGGRVMKSLAYSISSKFGFVFLALGFLACFILAWNFNLGLMTFLMVVGAIELFVEIKEMRRQEDRRRITAGLAQWFKCEENAEAVLGKLQLALDEAGRMDNDPSRAAEKEAYIAAVADDFEKETWFKVARGIENGAYGCRHLFAWTTAAVAMSCCRIHKRLFSRQLYQATDLEELRVSIKTVEISPLAKFLREKTKPAMTAGESTASFLVYAGLAAALAALMFAVSHIPAAEAALKVFMN